MASRVCSIPSFELDGQLTILLLDTCNQKNITPGDEQKIKVSCPLLRSQTCNDLQDQNPLNEREITPQQVSTIVIALVLSKDGYYCFLVSFKDYEIQSLS